MNSLLHRLKYNALTASIANRYFDRYLKDTKKFIFVATTGRSGTLTLVNIFNQLPNCVALHEPYPDMHNQSLKAAMWGDDRLVRHHYQCCKSVNIRRDAKNSEYYLEANHLFIKTFMDFAIEDFKDKLTVIHLVRDAAKVANSIYALQDHPGTPEGNNWWLDYHAPTNIIKIADRLESDFDHPFYKALWYWYEIEARVSRLKLDYPHIQVVPFRTEYFNEQDKLQSLFNTLGVEVGDDFIKQVVNVKSHARPEHKKVAPLSQEECTQRHEKFRQLLADLGYLDGATVFAHRRASSQ